MAREILRRGSESAPNDFSLPRDSWWEAAGKINSMTEEVYALQSQTINAGAVIFQSAPTIEGRIQLAIDAAVSGGFGRVYVPASMLPYDASSVTFNSNVQMVREGGVASTNLFDALAYGAADDGTADDGFRIQKMHDAMPANGGVMVLGTNHRLATAITLTKRCQLLGLGATDEAGLPAPTLLTKASTINGPGIIVANPECNLEGFYLRGESGNGGDGIVIREHSVSLRRIAVTEMGRDGIRIGDDASAVNVNSFHFYRVMSRWNGRHGCFIDDTAGGVSPDANGGVVIGLDVGANTGDGLKLGLCWLNTFVGILPQANQGAGVRISGGARWNLFIGGDLEEQNLGGNLVVESGALRNTIIPASLETGITDNGTQTAIITPTYQERKTGNVAALPANDATPSVSRFGYINGGYFFQTANSSSTTITDFDDGVDGQKIVVRSDANTGFAHSVNLRMKGATSITAGTMNSNQFIAFFRFANAWWEEYRNF